ncbi:hypothetical protein [Herminiimonas sp. KBW02]|uniref:hypothetical protein n=1 Tax=Herminiimonas sp. KBW02 TaxID=2153363 RepID=UPI0018F38252|nr:hypothetical protein [Herminiimonas sp. KBW02]
MRWNVGLLLVAVSVILTGCAVKPQYPVGLAPTAVKASEGRVGVAMTALPKVDTEFPGAGCLLCYAFASASNSALTTHTNTLPHEDLVTLKNELADLIRKKGGDVVVIQEVIDIKTLPDNAQAAPGIAKKDFSQLQKKYAIDKLLMVEITSLGMVRTYSAYVPTSDPKGMVVGTGYLVNLKTNAYEWYKRINIVKASESQWDEPPKFPGLTNAYFQALETGKDQFREPFLK